MREGAKPSWIFKVMLGDFVFISVTRRLKKFERNDDRQRCDQAFYLKNLTFTEIGGFGRQDNDPLKMSRH